MISFQLGRDENDEDKFSSKGPGKAHKLRVNTKGILALVFQVHLHILLLNLQYRNH